MNERDLFWERVDAALDERRDPLDDVEVQRLVAERPELLDELAHLQATLAHLPSATTQRSRRRVASLAFAALLAVTVATAWWLRRERREPLVALVTTPANGESRVLSFHAEVVVENSTGRTTTYFDGEHLVRTRETFAQPSSTDERGSPAFVAFVQSSSFVR